MMPTPLSLLLFVAAYWGLRNQTRIEEVYMLRTYGEAYRDYACRVGRFVPGVGKL
jgi:protein-S-isoprenylcysteine O-methyltransferase Ste14